MENTPNEGSFPKTTKDAENLKETAKTAAGEIGEVASKHASKAKEQVKSLASHAQEEGGQAVEAAQDSLQELTAAAKKYFSERPYLCLGVAFLLGAIFARSRRDS